MTLGKVKRNLATRESRLYWRSLQHLASQIAKLPKWMTAPPKPICDRCGSEDLVKRKGCIVCLKCGFKHDCNGW